MPKRVVLPIMLLSIAGLAYADSLNVRQIGSYGTSDVTKNIDVSGSYAFVSYSNTALWVIDISDRSNPVEVGSCQATP